MRRPLVRAALAAVVSVAARTSLDGWVVPVTLPDGATC